MSKVQLTVQWETSDHDGYCSDEECEYNSDEIIEYFDIPNQYKNCPIGTKLPTDIWRVELQKKGYKMDLGSGGLYFCALSHESEIHELDLHEGRATVLRAIIIDEDGNTHPKKHHNILYWQVIKGFM